MALGPANYRAQARGNGVDHTVQVRELPERELVLLAQRLRAAEGARGERT